MILVHTALLCEAQSIIEKYKLIKTNSNPKIYKNDTILVLIGGIGELNTTNSLEYIFENYTISKAINIGVAGCCDKSIKIGELFCTNQDIKNIRSMNLLTVNTPQTTKDSGTNLYDMEGEFFLKSCLKHLNKTHIFIFKILSDHLDDTILPKDYIKKLINNQLKNIPFIN